jgi:multiple antibiotic resistance protein
MPDFLGDIFQFAFVALTSIFFLVDPIAAIPTFLAMTSTSDRLDRRRMAKRAAWTCVVVLAAFAAAGKLIFRLFGITLPAFKIAGGVILLLIGLDMLQARRSQTKEAPGEAAEGSEKEDVGIIPLGVPMLAGPGAISTVMFSWAACPTYGIRFRCFWPSPSLRCHRTGFSPAPTASGSIWERPGFAYSPA